MVYSLNELRRRIAPVAVKYNLPAVYVFGSYARNEATDDSDVDILIDRTGSDIKGLFQMGGLYNDLCACVGKEVDLITTQMLAQDSTRRRAPWLVGNVMRERVIVYEAR